MLEGLCNKTQHCLIYGTQHQQHKVMFYPCFLMLLVGGWGGIFCSIVPIAHKTGPSLKSGREQEAHYNVSSQLYSLICTLRHYSKIG